MGILRVMSRNGDDHVAWDMQRVEAGDPEALAAVREAESIFRQQRERGATAFRSENSQAFVRMDEFDQTVGHIVIVPPVVGG